MVPGPIPNNNLPLLGLFDSFKVVLILQLFDQSVIEGDFFVGRQGHGHWRCGTPLLLCRHDGLKEALRSC